MTRDGAQFRGLFAIFSLAATLLLAPPARAQEGGAEESGDDAEIAGTEIGEITVTARFREENVQEVPGPISVISADDLEIQQIDNAREVRQATPNIVFERNTGTSSGAKIFLRGVGTDESLFTAEPAVGIYIDDVYIPRQTGASFDLFDLERVELLRGPQGTLYGRNTPGGALKLYTRKPSADRRFQLGLTAGDLGETNIQVSGGGGNDTVAGNFAVFNKQRDGFSTDLVNGREVNDEDVLAGRGKLAFMPGDGSTDVTISVDFVRERSTAGFPTSLLRNDDGDLRTLESGLDDMNDVDQNGASLHVSWLPDSGSFNLVSVTAYRSLDNLLLLDADGLPIPAFHLFQDQEQSQISQELRLTSAGGGNFDWTVGGFYFSEENDQPTQNIIFAPGAINTIMQDTTTYAIFGQGTWRTGDWSVTGGVRYSSEDKDIDVDSVLASGAPNFFFSDSDSWSTVDFRFELARRFSPNVLGYLTAATGFKSGGFNGRGGSPATINSFNEEENTTYELGFKSDLANRKVRLNMNYFLSQYDDLQLSILTPAGIFQTLNAADTDIQGLELELRAIPKDRLELNLTLGTLDGEYNRFDDPRFDADELELKQAPDVTARLGFLYTWLLGERGFLTWSTDWSYTDEHFQNAANSELIKTDAHDEINARFAYGAASGAWELAVVGTNLTDETYHTGGFDIGVLGIGAVYLNKPRWYGATFTYRFHN